MNSDIRFGDYSPEELGLSTRSYNFLRKNAPTVGDFLRLSEAEIRNFAGVGDVTFNEIVEFARRINVVLAKDTRTKAQISADKGHPNAGMHKAWQKGVRENPYRQIIVDLIGFDKNNIQKFNELGLTDEQLKANIDCVMSHLKGAKSVGRFEKSDAKIVARVAELRYGLNGAEPLTYKQISAIVGCDAGAKMQQFQIYMRSKSVWDVITGEKTWDEAQQELRDYLERVRQREEEELEERRRANEEWKNWRAAERKRKAEESRNARNSIGSNNTQAMGEDD